MLGSKIMFGTFTINDRATQPQLYAQSPYYYISVESVDGLHGADISYESHPIPNYIGEKSGDVFRRGKTVTLTGTVQGLNLPFLEDGLNYLKEMFWDTSLRKLIWTPRNATFEVYLKGRVNNDVSVVEQLTSHSYKYGWTVGIRCDDPRTRKNSDDSLWPTWQTL